MSSPRRRATYDDLCRVPDHMVAEIVEGQRLYVTSRPASPHANAASVLRADLNGAFHGPPGEPKRRAPRPLRAVSVPAAGGVAPQLFQARVPTTVVSVE